MAIAYTKPSRKLPLGERVAHITNIAQGDVVDIEDILGYSCRYLKITTPDSGDVLGIRLNNKYTLTSNYNAPGYPENGSPDPSSAVTIQSKGAQHPVHALTGDTIYYTEDGIVVGFLELVTMTPNTGTAVIELMAW